MKKCLIVCRGFFGDHIFANSIAEHLIKEKQYDEVDYVIGFPQVLPFFDRNPFVNKIYLESLGSTPTLPSNFEEYDKCFRLKPLNWVVPPAVEMQLECGVKNPSPHFYINTNPELDKFANEYISETRSKTSLPIVAVMTGWKERTFRFTREEYTRGIDVPYLGYGGANRDVEHIISKLSEKFPITTVGVSKNINQYTLNHDEQFFDLTASLIKVCDFFVGAEGGLANVAYAVGTNTILTSDFVHQLYGPNGVMRKNVDPKLGPVHYTSDSNKHINLDPYLTDDEVIESMVTIINNSHKN
jgi:hypothetical protein